MAIDDSGRHNKMLTCSRKKNHTHTHSDKNGLFRGGGGGSGVFLNACSFYYGRLIHIQSISMDLDMDKRQVAKVV